MQQEELKVDISLHQGDNGQAYQFNYSSYTDNSFLLWHLFISIRIDMASWAQKTANQKYDANLRAIKLFIAK